MKSFVKQAITVLVLGAGGNVSQGIIKALKETQIPMKIIGACVWEFSKGLYMCDEGYICPYANDDQFIPWVIDFCNKHYVDIIFTGVEENIIELAKHKEVFKRNTKAIFISSSYDKLLIGQDKYLTCQFLENSGCNYPNYRLWENEKSIIQFVDEVGFPIIAKPRNGKSSRGIYVFHTEEDIAKKTMLDNYVLEECIGTSDSEYTVGCYVDKKGQLQGLIPMKRKLWNGTTVWAKTIESRAIEEECIKICNAFKPTGPLNIQLRVDKEGRPVCFELNVRFSGTTAMRSHFGFMDVKAMILEYIYAEDTTTCFKWRSGEAFRFDEELYLIENTTDTMKKDKMISNIKTNIFR